MLPLATRRHLQVHERCQIYFAFYISSFHLTSLRPLKLPCDQYIRNRIPGTEKLMKWLREVNIGNISILINIATFCLRHEGSKKIRLEVAPVMYIPVGFRYINYIVHLELIKWIVLLSHGTFLLLFVLRMHGQVQPRDRAPTLRSQPCPGGHPSSSNDEFFLERRVTGGEIHWKPMCGFVCQDHCREFCTREHYVPVYIIWNISGPQHFSSFFFIFLLLNTTLYLHASTF